MRFSYNWLKEYIDGKAPSAQKLADIFLFHSFEVEEVKKIGNDFMIDLKILPNRIGDCSGHFGLAREVSVVTRLKFNPILPKIKLSSVKETADLAIESQNKNDCPRYSAVIIRNVKVGESPKWLKDRLIVCGLKPINNIVDITNYVMLETGQPLHAFDLDKIKTTSNKNDKEKSKKFIIIRRARKGETIKTLDEAKQEYNLDENILLIADSAGPIAIAGIKGGATTAIDKQTKNIVLESANFEKSVIRKGSQSLKLRTDASVRFENNLSPELIQSSQERACFLIEDIAKGNADKAMVDLYPRKQTSKKISLDLNRANNLLGVATPKKEVEEILTKLGFAVVGKKQNLFIIEPPFFRQDAESEEDLIEEIGRIRGYEKINSIAPQSLVFCPQKDSNIYRDYQIKETFQQLGFDEVFGYSFLSLDDLQIFSIEQKQCLELENPMSGLYRFLRPCLLPKVLKIARENLKNFPTVKIFEIGNVFSPKERKSLAGVWALSQKKKDVFSALKGDAQVFLGKMGLDNCVFSSWPDKNSYQASLLHPAKSSLIKYQGKAIGFVGELNPKLCAQLEIGADVFVLSIDLSLIYPYFKNERKYNEISLSQKMTRDLSVICPVAQEAGEILRLIYEKGKPFIYNAQVLALYQGKEIGEGKKNILFRLEYRKKGQNLTSEEVDSCQQTIIKEITQNNKLVVKTA